jgi:hypothetical protein
LSQDPHKIRDRPLYIVSRLRRRFDEFAAQLESESRSFLLRHLPANPQVVFVAYQDQNFIFPLYALHNVAEGLESVKSGSAGDRVDE